MISALLAIIAPLKYLISSAVTTTPFADSASMTSSEDLQTVPSADSPFNLKELGSTSKYTRTCQKWKNN